MFPHLTSFNDQIEEADCVTQGEKEVPENRENPGGRW